MQIGPGTGNLTKHLLSRGAIVTAVEKDDTLYARLLEEYKDVSVGGVKPHMRSGGIPPVKCEAP